MHEPQSEERPRVVLLGASNLTIGLPAVLRAAAGRLGLPLEVLAALGRGRSYGADSYFIFRRLGGIEGCGLWRALAGGGRRPTWALVTDVGNDLAFGAAPGQVLGWVETALERLGAAGARTVITSLPLEKLRKLSAWKFELWRHLIFPLHRTPRAALLAGAEALDEGLRSMARERGLELVEPRSEWYGADPIHVRRSRRDQAWERILSSWGDPDRALRMPGLPAPWALVPERRRVLWIEGGRQQPCARLSDGTTLALY